MSVDSSSRALYFIFSLVISCSTCSTWSFSCSRAAETPASCCSSSSSLIAPSGWELSRLDHVTPSYSFMCSSPGSLLLQEVVFVLDLKLQLCHLTGELKEHSDVTSVALPPMAARGSSGVNLEPLETNSPQMRRLEARKAEETSLAKHV